MRNILGVWLLDPCLSVLKSSTNILLTKQIHPQKLWYREPFMGRDTALCEFSRLPTTSLRRKFVLQHGIGGGHS